MNSLVTWMYRRWRASQKGQIALSFALGLPALLGGAGIAIDYGMMSRMQSSLQKLADSAATAAARELALANSSKQQVEAVATLYAEQGGNPGGVKVNVKTDVNLRSGEVKVLLSQNWRPVFMHLIDNTVTPISASATAQLVNSGKICVVGLMKNIFASVHLDNRSQLKADNCGIYSNSTSVASIRADMSAKAKAESMCAVGGYTASLGTSLDPRPTTGCPKIPDPLADRSEPAVGPCIANDLEIDTDTRLKPGNYCGGLHISGKATVKLDPGVYTISGGKLMVSGQAKLVGENVGFYLAADSGTLEFAARTTIDLSAPKDTSMAGLLFFESRSVSGTRIHKIRSNNARNLIGTIYMPKSILQVDANGTVADESAYTAIVVLRLWLKEGPTLVLNSNYSATDVPVPRSLSGGQVVLSE